jgi:hypothetical protein
MGVMMRTVPRGAQDVIELSAVLGRRHSSDYTKPSVRRAPPPHNYTRMHTYLVY